MKKNIIPVLLTVLLFSCSDTTLPPPEGLLCELLRNPEKAVITDSIPEFSWVFPVSGITQNACRILVASSSSILSEGKADYWDSGKLLTSESVNLEYGGKTLIPNKSFWWKVRIWDKNERESAYSEPQQFNTSYFQNSNDEWPGKSDYVELSNSTWVSENRQTSTFHTIKPILFVNTKPGSWFADFGKASFATLEMSATTLSNNDTLEIFLGERKNHNLTVNQNSGRSNIGFEKFQLNLIKGTHNYKIEIPTHHSGAPNTQKLAPFYPEVLPFRYVEINGQGADVVVKELEQLALFYPFDDDVSSFESSDTNLNKVWELCKYTLKATPFLGVYADGNRERMPYEADSYIQQLGHYCVDREYSIARYTTNFLIFNPSWPTEWNLHIILMAWQDYMHTGNKEFLSKMYNKLKSKTLIALAREDGLISTTTGKVTQEFLNSIYKIGGIQDIVDWPKGTPKGSEQAGNAGPTPEGERDSYVFTDINTVVNSFHYHALILMSKIAEVLEYKNDKIMFITNAVKVKNSLLEKLFDNKRGLFIDGEGTDHSSLHANMFPLAFNLVPSEHINTVVEFIKSRGMACSVYGAQYLLEALFIIGESDYAISLMTSESKRGWLNMLNVGSTMTTEAWDEYYKPNLTWNHAWGSAPANIIPRRLLGIEPIKEGFEKFRVAPQPGNLTDLKLKLPSIRGSILCDLSVLNDEWIINISIPGNSEAEVCLPEIFKNVSINLELKVPQRNEIFAGKLRNIFVLPSGTYTIRAN
jgi:alpha-L-rhamnosidase